MKVSIKVSKDLAITAIGHHLMTDNESVNRHNFNRILANYVASYGISCMTEHDNELEVRPKMEDKAVEIVDNFYHLPQLV